MNQRIQIVHPQDMDRKDAHDRSQAQYKQLLVPNFKFPHPVRFAEFPYSSSRHRHKF